MNVNSFSSPMRKYTGPVELAAVGVSIALFNQVSRVAIFPLVSVTTSFVAEEDTTSPEALEVSSESKELIPQKGRLSFIVYLQSENSTISFMCWSFRSENW